MKRKAFGPRMQREKKTTKKKNKRKMTQNRKIAKSQNRKVVILTQLCGNRGFTHLLSRKNLRIVILLPFDKGLFLEKKVSGTTQFLSDAIEEHF